MNLYPFMVSLGMPEGLADENQATWLCNREMSRNRRIHNLEARNKELATELTALNQLKALADTPLVVFLTRARQLASIMLEVAEFSEAHHGDQERHVLLHALRVDIPSRLREALK